MCNFRKRGRLIDYIMCAVESYYRDHHHPNTTKTNDVYYSSKVSLELLNDCYTDYASTLEWRIKDVSQALNYNQPPVILAPFGINLFPTGGYENDDSVTFFKHPHKIFKTTTSTSHLVFDKEVVGDANTSGYTFIQQHQRLHAVMNYFRNLPTEQLLRKKQF